MLRRCAPSLLLLLTVGPGCQSNTVKLEFESAEDRDYDDDSGTGDPTDGMATMTTASSATETTGTNIDPTQPFDFLLVVSTTLDPSLPLQGYVTATPNGSTVDLTLQWLSLSPGSTNAPRQPVGDVYAYAGLPYDANAGFAWTTGIILIPGAANPLTGEDLVGSITVAAELSGVDAPLFCGAADGQITMPFDAALAGSTHSMTVVPDVGQLPSPVALGCP